MNKIVIALTVLALACTGGQNEKSTETNGTNETPETGTTGTKQGATGATGATGSAVTGAGTLESAKKRAEAALARQSPKATIEVGVVKGPDGLSFVRARDPKAYPGTGVAALVFDGKSGKTYGAHGEHKLATLFVERGWFASPPSDGDITRLVHQGFFNGVLILKDSVIEKSADAIVVTLPAYTMAGDLDRTLVVTLGKDGTDTVAKK